jgi:hypothetical protein
MVLVYTNFVACLSADSATNLTRRCARPSWFEEDGCYLEQKNDSCPLRHKYDCNSFYFGLSGPAHYDSTQMTRVCSPGEISGKLSARSSHTVGGMQHLCEYDVVCKSNSTRIPSTYWQAELKNDNRCASINGRCAALEYEMKVLENKGCDPIVGQHRYRLEKLVISAGYVCLQLTV